MSKLNSGQLESLKPNETLLLSARKIKGGKISLEFAEVIQTADRPTSVLSIMNQSDPRFSSRARRAWVSAEPKDATKVFGANFGDDGEWYMSDKGEILDLNMLNPLYHGTRMRLRINETTEATEWQSENVKTAAKRRGKDGDYITHKGSYIFSNVDVVLTDGEITHTFLEADTTAVEAETTETVNKETGEVKVSSNVEKEELQL
jgi:hypothetical protein